MMGIVLKMLLEVRIALKTAVRLKLGKGDSNSNQQFLALDSQFLQLTGEIALLQAQGFCSAAHVALKTLQLSSEIAVFKFLFPGCVGCRLCPE